MASFVNCRLCDSVHKGEHVYVMAVAESFTWNGPALNVQFCIYRTFVVHDNSSYINPKKGYEILESVHLLYKVFL